ncbi:MAG: RNA-binding S4 domain-containing protein [Candidatus Marinimicrobia bacterium]|nr:RNA-binding S4 domain-containing protein [Candidatus Neomarinimicrobiota bacterium]
MTEATRIDKWLWSARMFKTRTAATSACVAGKVKLNGQGVKPSRAVAVGDTIQITRVHHRQRIEVRGLAIKRVAAKLAAGLYEDVTPEEELEREQQAKLMNAAFRQARGTYKGRPTKKERRTMQKFRDQR